MFKTILFLYLFYTITRKLSSMSKVTTNRLFELTILHTNDVHARFEPFSDKGTSCKANKVCYGGVARRSSYVKQVRAEEPNVLLLDAGDQFQGTPWFFTYKGAAASLFLNELDYTAMALGNHEFDNGLEGLNHFMKNVTVSILCSNMVRDSKVPEVMKKTVEDYKIVKFGNKSVGIIGYITKEVTVLSSTDGLSFKDEDKVIGDVAKNLTAAGIDIIIALGHSGLSNDKNMAAKIPAIDVFVGGHAHSFLYNGTPPTNEIVVESYPVEVPRRNSTGLVVHAGPFGKYVGKIKVTFDENGNVLKWVGNPVLMDSSIPEDKDLQKKVDHLKVEIEKLYGEGSSAMDFDVEKSICRAKECEMGNMYADAMMDYNQEWKADVAIVNSGLFRASLSEGNVTYGDAITVFPFKGDIRIVSLLGSHLRMVFEHSVVDFSLLSKHGKFLQVSKEVFVKYDLTRDNGQRVVDLQIYNKARKQYEDVSDNREYRIIMRSWMVGGGDGYEVVKIYHKKQFHTNIEESDVFLVYLKKYSPIKAKLEGRINGMTTFPGWSDVYTEVPWDPPKKSNANSFCKYQAFLLTIILSILLQFLFSASYLCDNLLFYR